MAITVSDFLASERARRSISRWSRLNRQICLGLVLMACWSLNAQAENWTRFRGPNGSGDAGATRFPVTWTEEDYLWKKTLEGVGHSSPVGWENQLYVTSGNPDTGAFTLFCFAADNGEELWHSDFAGQKYQMHAFNSYASTTPTVDEQRVYLSWAAGGKMQSAAFSHQGDELWRTDLGDFTESHGFAASPIVVDGVVCLQVDSSDEGFLVGIDAVSGDERWRAKRPGGKASYATPCVVSTAGSDSAVISHSMTGGIQAIDIQTGKQLWQLDDVFPARCVSSPVIVGDLVFGTCGGGGSGKALVGVQLAPSATDQPTERLVLTKHVPYVPTPVVKGQWMFLWHDQGKVSCADLNSEDPSKLLWTKRIGGKFFGSPILAGDKIYCLSSEGKAIVLAADKEFSLLGENDLGSPTYATPAVHQGKMYLRTETSLACLPAE